ncbi:hypothetical protein MTR67_012460 [Solanum verrucosum]|uniref:Uncharacterized protein n=1 Tax=Solanum verrucosum TaxID=315347 RepID=A0AAF0TMX9_SOLVR|nr:hypothetical protein MTR67_012460 [Solanum verrucosum]
MRVCLGTNNGSRVPTISRV